MYIHIFCHFELYCTTYTRIWNKYCIQGYKIYIFIIIIILIILRCRRNNMYHNCRPGARVYMNIHIHVTALKTVYINDIHIFIKYVFMQTKVKRLVVLYVYMLTNNGVGLPNHSSHDQMFYIPRWYYMYQWPHCAQFYKHISCTVISCVLFSLFFPIYETRRERLKLEKYNTIFHSLYLIFHQMFSRYTEKHTGQEIWNIFRCVIHLKQSESTTKTCQI